MCQFGERNTRAARASSSGRASVPTSKHPEQGWRWSACGFCSGICLPLPVEDPHVWPHGRSRWPTLGRAHACGSDSVMERVPTPQGAGPTGQGCGAPARPQRCGLPSAPLPSGLGATGQRVRAASGTRGQRGGETPQAALRMRESRAWRHGGRGRSQACESRPECAGYNRSAATQAASCRCGGQACSHTLFSAFYRSNREQSYRCFFPRCG